MEFTFTREKGKLVICVKGRMDTLCAPSFQKTVEEHLKQGDVEIVTDCTDLEYVGSAGLRCFLVAAQKAKQAGGELTCCSLQEMVKKVFQISGFSKMIPTFECVNDALEQK